MASMSKRAQARTEKELHDLLRAPGNSACADCGARNPAWASWNLGVFLCMRCASIHRKLGTHISKVKSLSMDTWTNEQLDTMKKNGNLAVNKVYNPKNKRPDMPLDADEVDGAMERFIRKKYQEKSLSDGRPEVPSRDNIPPQRSISPENSPPPPLPSKKGRFFGFGLRSSSSAYPLSKHDKKHKNQPRMDNNNNNIRMTSEDYTSTTRTNSARGEMSDTDLQVKLAQLRDMGFSDNERNMNQLKRHNGDLEQTIATLVKLGPAEQPTARRTTPAPISTSSVSAPQNPASAPQSATVSLNPYNQFNHSPTPGLSFGNSAPQSPAVSSNPWQNAMSSQHNTGLEQSFGNMQVSQPPFTNTTGGYSAQPQYAAQPPFQQMPSTVQQYPMTNSPVSMNNPFMQAPLSAHSTGSNPYASHMQSIPNFAPSANPFLSMQTGQSSQQAGLSNQGTNPFGLPPSNSPPQARVQPAVQQPQSNPYYDTQSAYPQAGQQSSIYGAEQHTPQQQFMQSNGMQSPSAMPNFQYGQTQSQQFSPQPQQQQPQMQVQSPTNPFFQPQQFQQQQQQQQPAQPMMPQQTGHMDKKSILALYNFPQLAPSKPLAPIHEPTEDQNQSQPAQTQQVTSPAPTGALYNSNGTANSGKRSATMPVSSLHSSGGPGSRNPFMTSSANNSASSTPATQSQPFGTQPQAARHTSHDSMMVNNQRLEEGRHSPDAFAGLSARYMR